MHIFFDESGDYSFPPDRFDCYVQAALICPDSQLESVDAYVEARKQELGVVELHAASLTSPQLLGIAGFIGATSGCQLLAHVTDTALVTRSRIAEFRLDQAAKIERNLDQYRQESTRVRGRPVPEIEEWMLRQIKRAGLASQITDGEFGQAQYLVELISAALQKSLLAYAHESWAGDFADYGFVVDAKLPRKLAAGEKYLNDLLVPVLGSRRGMPLIIPSNWTGPPAHPFIEKYQRDRGIRRGVEVENPVDLNAVFEHGLSFENSAERPGLQLADCVAHVVRRAVLRPEDTTIQRAFDQLRPRLRNHEGSNLTIHRLRVGEEDTTSLARYVRLAGPDAP